MELSATHMWLLAGALFVGLEIFGISGIGFFFAGIAALTTGILIQGEFLDATNYFSQTAWFMALTVAWALILWKPIQKIFPRPKHSSSFSNMIGDTAYISAAGLKKGHIGEATWSGTIMKAEIASDASIEHISGGVAVVITDVRGATLVVKPK